MTFRTGAPLAGETTTMTLFRTPTRPEGITFLLRGDAGTGKTRFAYGLSRITSKAVAVIGSDRSAGFYEEDPAFGRVAHVEVRDAAALDRALDELERRAGDFGAVVADTITEWWSLEQKEFEVERDGERVIPMRSWRLLRAAHESRLLRLQSLGLHVVLVCEERPIYERVGADIVEVGSREDTDKKDAYLADVRLRFFTRDGKRMAEVLKDRTGRYAMGAVVEDPRVESWLGAPFTTAPARAGKPHPLDALGRELIDAIGEIETADHWRRWRKKHSKTLAALFRALPDSPTKRKLIAIGKAKKARFDSTPPGSLPPSHREGARGRASTATPRQRSRSSSSSPLPSSGRATHPAAR